MCAAIEICLQGHGMFSQPSTTAIPASGRQQKSALKALDC
jgi:hypothetical protein